MERVEYYLSELKKLSVDERIWIVQELWDSIAAEPEKVPLTDEQREELDRRIAAYEASPEEVSSLEEVMERVAKRIEAGSS
jgi:putative addiction module component (TIGR02574 family)